MPSIREFAGQYQRLSKYTTNTRNGANTRIGYSPIRGHTRTFAQVHRDVSAYEIGHGSPNDVSFPSVPWAPPDSAEKPVRGPVLKISLRYAFLGGVLPTAYTLSTRYS